jgi:hypothetical protein
MPHADLHYMPRHNPLLTHLTTPCLAEICTVGVQLCELDISWVLFLGDDIILVAGY